MLLSCARDRPTPKPDSPAWAGAAKAQPSIAAHQIPPLAKRQRRVPDTSLLPVGRAFRPNGVALVALPTAPGIRSANQREARLVVEDYAKLFLFADCIEATSYLRVRRARVARDDKYVIRELGENANVGNFRHRRAVHDDEPLLVPPPQRIHQALHLLRCEMLLESLAPLAGGDDAVARNADRLDDVLDVEIGVFKIVCEPRRLRFHEQLLRAGSLEIAVDQERGLGSIKSKCRGKISRDEAGPASVGHRGDQYDGIPALAVLDDLGAQIAKRLHDGVLALLALNNAPLNEVARAEHPHLVLGHARYGLGMGPPVRNDGGSRYGSADRHYLQAAPSLASPVKGLLDLAHVRIPLVKRTREIVADAAMEVTTSKTSSASSQRRLFRSSGVHRWGTTVMTGSLFATVIALPIRMRGSNCSRANNNPMGIAIPSSMPATTKCRNLGPPGACGRATGS